MRRAEILTDVPFNSHVTLYVEWLLDRCYADEGLTAKEWEFLEPFGL